MTSRGRFFEDFSVGEVIHHATPRTVTQGDVALYTALYGSRFAPQASDVFARAIGYPHAPVDDLLVFHIVFGKTVPDISLNAVANLGYAGCRFLHAVYPGDTLSAVSEVIGIRENKSGSSGVVYVRSQGHNQDGTLVLDYVRWVMVRKRDDRTEAPKPQIPEVPAALAADAVGDAAPLLSPHQWDDRHSGSARRFQHYEVGETFDHGDGVTVEEAEHQLATRLYHNTARVHFDQHLAESGRFGRRLVYGGHVISIARALSFNGLANAWHLAAINGGRHVAPLFAGDTVYAWSEILDRAEMSGRDDAGALRLRTIAARNHPCEDLPRHVEEERYHPAVVLDLDYWVLMPR